MLGLGLPELVVVLVVVLLIFGPRKLPELGELVGKSLRELRNSLEGRDELDDRGAPPDGAAGPTAENGSGPARPPAADQ